MEIVTELGTFVGATEGEIMSEISDARERWAKANELNARAELRACQAGFRLYSMSLRPRGPSGIRAITMPISSSDQIEYKSEHGVIKTSHPGYRVIAKIQDGFGKDLATVLEDTTPGLGGGQIRAIGVDGVRLVLVDVPCLDWKIFLPKSD